MVYSATFRVKAVRHFTNKSGLREFTMQSAFFFVIKRILAWKSYMKKRKSQNTINVGILRCNNINKKD